MAAAWVAILVAMSSSVAGVTDAMLKLANVTPEDVVYDLGSGDGRIVIAAAKKYGARFDMGDWKPEADVRLEGTHVYLWTIK